MAHFNKVIILGHLTRDPEVRVTPSGTAVATFGLAVNRRYQQDGAAKEEVCFVDITAFGHHAEVIGAHLAKGRAVLVEGRLRWSRWDTDGGQKRSKLDVVAERVEFLARREASASDDVGGVPRDIPEDDVPF